MHAEPLDLNISELLETTPIKPSTCVRNLALLGIIIGVLVFSIGVFGAIEPEHLWGAYFTNLVFFMGLAAGSCMISVMVQIVRATWSVPVRRLAEANLGFLPYVYMLFLVSYFGADYLFAWAKGPMPGKEWWMQPDFVYIRFAVLFGGFFLFLRYYIRLSLRGDVGFMRDHSSKKQLWQGGLYDRLTSGWTNTEKEVYQLHPRMSVMGPVVVFVYVIVFSLFAFEMIMGMNPIWYSNMYGGFHFLGNIYVGWAVLALSTMLHARGNPEFSKTISGQQLWDLGKLTFAFCMLWGYTFFAQYLPQWYGNLPEETAWMFLRARDRSAPWWELAWVVFPMCFIIPFVTLISEDIKRAPKALGVVCCIVFAGLWLEKYLTIMPELYPDKIPFNFVEISIFLGFLGAYVLSIQSFMAKYPFNTLSHPQAQELTDW